MQRSSATDSDNGHVAEVLTATTTRSDAREATPLDDFGPTARFGLIAVGAAFILAIATFLVFAGFTPILPTANVVAILLLGDGLVVFVLIVLIGIELARLRAARKAARAGARLHSRFVALFSLVAAIPAIVTAVVATVSVEWAINPRFMSDVAAFINESNQATQLYREFSVPRPAPGRRIDRRRYRPQRSIASLRSGSVQNLLQFAIQGFRIQRCGADEG